MRCSGSIRALFAVSLVAAFGVAHSQTLVGSFTWADNGHLYELYSTSGISYDDAAAFARTNGGYLATITSADENTAVTSNLGGLLNLTAYLGAAQPASETDVNANWSWITGEAWSYAPWAGGEPNDFNGPASEQFLEMYADGSWNDIGQNSDGYNFDFIVETVPEPSALVACSLAAAALLKRRRRLA